jgi:membrane-bound lytic murein transglycosylase D
VTVTVATSLATLGEACGGLPEAALEELNPALRVSVTPPGEVWPVRVPPGFVESCREGLASLPPETRETFRYYEASVGEPLDVIAEKLGTTEQAILRFHGHEDEERMLDYAEIAVPVPYARAKATPIVAPSPRRVRGGSYGPGGARLVRHRVRPGDSLWKVARRYDVSMAKLRAWNGLWRTNTLRIGQRLRVYVGRGARRVTGRRPRRTSARAGKAGVHQVREGESLWSIARRHGTTVERLRALNGIEPGGVLSIGQELRLR